MKRYELLVWKSFFFLFFHLVIKVVTSSPFLYLDVGYLLMTGSIIFQFPNSNPDQNLKVRVPTLPNHRFICTLRPHKLLRYLFKKCQAGSKVSIGFLFIYFWKIN